MSWVQKTIGTAVVAAVGGAASFFGFTNRDAVTDFVDGMMLNPESERVQFLFGDWCASSGERQRFEADSGKKIRTQHCRIEAGRPCDASTVDAASVRTAELGVFAGKIVYSYDDSDIRMIVKKEDDRHIQQYPTDGPGFGEWSRCSAPEGAPAIAATPEPGAAPAQLGVEDFTPPTPLEVFAQTSVNLRSAPSAGKTPKLGKGQPGDPIDVTGIARKQADGYDWYRIRLEDGSTAFIRADYTRPRRQAGLEPDDRPGLHASPVSLTTVARAPARQPVVIAPRLPAGALKPDYPAQSRQRGEQGEVRLNLCVDRHGKVTDARLAQSSGHTRLDDAALRRARGQAMQPATSDGVAFDSCDASVTYTFELDS